MNEKLWPILLCSALLGGAYSQRPASPPVPAADHGATSAAKGEAGSPAAPADDDEALREPRRLVREFFGATSPRRAPSLAGQAGRLLIELSATGEKVRLELPLVHDDPDRDNLAELANAAHYGVEFLIALVPDPIDSQLPANFDQSVDAIQAGMAEAGYLQDRLWLPWQGPAAASKLYQKSPGLLLFRTSSPAPPGRRLKLVFLVGETQKVGIHKRAFLAAMTMIKQFSRATWASAEQVDVLGPAFSGSAESLRLTLALWRGSTGAAPPSGSEVPIVPPVGQPIHALLTSATPLRNGILAATSPPLPPTRPVQDVASREPWKRFRIVTGSATAPSLDDSFRGVADCFGRALAKDDLLKQQFLNLAIQLGWNLEKVALLIEGDTAYGQEFGMMLESTKFLQVAFPSRIAGFRTARERDGKRAAPQGNDPLEVRRTELNLSLADHGQPIDLVPDFSPDSSRSTELVIANLFEGLARRDIRYVGIVASDVKDTLFLAEKIRAAVPHAVRFTFNNNILEAHPQFSNAINGLLVFSGVRLHDQELARDSHQRSRKLVQFASGAQQGVFLAVRRLLGPADRACDLSPERIWMSVVGNGALWPLASLPAASGGDGFRSPAGTGAAADPASGEDAADLEPGGKVVAWLAAGALLLALAEWLHRTARTRRPDGELQYLNGHGLAATCGYAALWGLGALLLAAYSMPLWLTNEPGWGLLSFPRFVSGLVALVILYSHLVWRFVTSTPALTRLRWRESSAPAWVLSGLGALVAAGAVLWLWMPGGWESARYLYLRLEHPASGFSPLLPVACLGAALYVAALLEVKRRVMEARQRMDWPLPLLNWPSQEQPEPQLADAALLAGKVDSRLQSRRAGVWRRRQAWQLAAAVVLLVLLSRLFQYLQPITEPRRAGWLFLLLLAAAFALSARSLYRFFTLWGAMNKVLDRLCYTWLLPALRSESGSVGWNALKSFGWKMPSFKMMIIAVDRLKELSRLRRVGSEEDEVGELVERSLGETESRLEQALLADGGGDLQQEIGSRARLQARLHDATHDLEAQRIRLGGSSLPAELLAPATPAPPLSHRHQVIRAIEGFLALRVIAYVRYVFAHLRYDLLGAILPGLLLLLGMSFYAFEPKQLYSLGAWAALLTASAVTMLSFAQMDRDAALSAIGGTPAGKVSFNRTFWVNIFTYGFVPLLGVIVTQFPQLGQLFVSWADPVLRAVSSK